FLRARSTNFCVSHMGALSSGGGFSDRCPNLGQNIVQIAEAVQVRDARQHREQRRALALDFFTYDPEQRLIVAVPAFATERIPALLNAPVPLCLFSVGHIPALY